jgi:hypothetical protein
MSKTQPDQKKADHERFADQAGGPQAGLLAEFVYFLLHNKKWWITPIVLVLLAFGLLIMLGGSTAAPFIYTLF